MGAGRGNKAIDEALDTSLSMDTYNENREKQINCESGL